MKKAAVITFHASHNYGSVLQAYALQTLLTQLVGNCEIINLRTERQKDLYTVFTKRKGLKYCLKNLTHALYYFALKQKYNRFNQFITEQLKTTSQIYLSLDDLQNESFNYDYYICGSDQIWNPNPVDFDWSYYLPFVKKGKKISYAPSFGPIGKIPNEEIRTRIADYLASFDSLSVRELKSQQIVQELSHKEVPIVLDPTLLLTPADWEYLLQDKKYKNEKYKNKDYILLYTLYANPQIISLTKFFSRYFKMPIVITNFSNQYDVLTPFKKQYDVGPIEFLTVLKNAKIVLTSSFHGTVFSILFNKPFFTFEGNKDARIHNLLSLTDLTNRSINSNNVLNQLEHTYDIDFERAQKLLENEKNKSLAYLRNALEIDSLEKEVK